MEGFGMLTPLFEAQDDFPQIESMICSMFGIPADARILVGDMGHGHVEDVEVQKLAKLQGELGTLGITDSVANIMHNYEDPADYVSDKHIAEQETATKLLGIGFELVNSIMAKRQEKLAGVKAAIEHPGEHDYIPADLAAHIDENNIPDLVSLAEYIRVKATGAMTYQQDFGIGNSQIARDAIAKGTSATFQDTDYDEFFNGLATTSSVVEHLPESVRHYIALASRKYLQGILRVAFSDLGLMGYLCDRFPDIHDAMARLGIRVTDQYSAVKLSFFGKKVVPAIIIRDTLARLEPSKTYTKADMGKALKFLGKEMTDAFRDTIEPLDVTLDSNFTTSDGNQLDFNELTDIADSGDVLEADVLKNARQNLAGEEYVYNPDAANPLVKIDTQLTKTGDGDLECAAYKVGRWYVVYVPDREHSGSGWFHFPEPANKRADKRFYFRRNGDDDGHSGLGEWCIVYNPGSYWRNYIESDDDYAYYLVRDDALEDDVIDHGCGAERYYSTAVGCVFSGSDDERRGREKGIIIRDECLIDRGDSYVISGGTYYHNWKKYAPVNMLTEHMSRLKWNYNLTIFALNLIGKWDTSVTGEENIIAKVRELAATWFPDHGGEIRETKHGIPSIHVPDMGTAAMVLNAGPRHQSDARANSLSTRSMTINLDGTEYKIGEVRPASSDNQLNQLWIFKPADMGEEELTDDVKCLVFECNTDTGKFKPCSSVPIEYGKIAEKVNEAKTPDSTGDKYTADTGDTEVTWFHQAKGKSRNSRVGWGKDNSIWISDGEHTENVGKWHIPYSEMAGGIESIPMTFIKVDGGVNLIAMNPVNNTVLTVGYVRRGVCHMYNVKASTRYGTMVLEDTQTHKYTIGDPLGEVKRFNRDQYEAYIYISASGSYVDGTGLSAEGLERVAEGHRGEIGLVIPNGRYGENGDFSGGVGIVHWYTAETVGGNYGAETVLEIGDLRTDGRKPPFYGDL